MSYGEFIHEKNPKTRLGVLFYHMHTFNFFLPGVGKTQRNILEALVPFSLSFQIGIFLKSRLEIWHGHSSVQKTSFLLPFKQITNVFAYSFLLFFFLLLWQIWIEKLWLLNSICSLLQSLVLLLWLQQSWCCHSAEISEIQELGPSSLTGGQRKPKSRYPLSSDFQPNYEKSDRRWVLMGKTVWK